MRQLLIFILWFLFGHVAVAANVPELTFTQATNIVVAAKQANPALLDLRIIQAESTVQLTAIVANNLSQAQAKALGLSVLRLVKSMSLDTPLPNNTQNKPHKLGRGLYDYTLNITKPNAQSWLQAHKPQAKAFVRWQDVSPAQPATRQLIQQLQPPQKTTISPPTAAVTTPPSQVYKAGQAPVFGAP